MKKEDRLNREEIISFLGMLAKFNTVIAILFSITLIVYFNTSDYQILGLLFFFIYILVKLIENLSRSSLFDSLNTVRQLESAYLAMREKSLQGLQPENIYIEQYKQYKN